MWSDLKRDLSEIAVGLIIVFLLLLISSPFILIVAVIENYAPDWVWGLIAAIFVLLLLFSHTARGIYERLKNVAK